MKTIKSLNQLNKIDFELIDENEFWNYKQQKELSIHSVHVYPAKFPSLIAQKSFLYAKKHHMKISRVADVFCGCGTVAVEARRLGYDFWGCDLNPVAVLLSKVKTSIYDPTVVRNIGNEIIESFKNSELSNEFDNANERLKYWYEPNQYNELFLLKSIIDDYKMEAEYHDLFQCIFSSILKSTSKWLTKSIKPQVDPNKVLHNVIETFGKQLNVFIKAITEEDYKKDTNIEIECNDVLKITKEDYVDLIVSSPPYVTSYEYADLHQLSSLWLKYADDYTELRKNSIGSQYRVNKDKEETISFTAKKIVDSFPNNVQGKSIARYYSQMNKVLNKCYNLLRKGGRSIFVIGDTEYKSIKIENARCLAESMLINGFIIEQITKRKIENKFLPSHRDKTGKFSSSKNDRKIYSQEYIIIGRKI